VVRRPRLGPRRMSHAWSGFEGEAYRQSLLTGRRFTDYDKAMRVKQFSGVDRASITAHFELPDISSRRAATACASAGDSRRDPAAFPRAGERTNNGVADVRYNILSGEAAPATWRLMPTYGAHAARIPIHTLEGVAQRRSLLADEDAAHRPPTSRTAGVTRGVDMGREYAGATSAFSPAGFRSPGGREIVTERAVEYRSFQSLKHDKTKHARTVNEPLTRAAAPMLSSQSYGWEATLSENKRRAEVAAARVGGGEVVAATARRARVGCRETKMAQSILVGPRHVHGYSGQGTQ